jgi:hypothetical protein
MEEDLNAVTLSVASLVDTWLLLACRIRANHRLDPERLQLFSYRVGIVCCIREESLAARMVGYDGFRDGRLVLLPGRDFDVERAPFDVDERVDFRGEPTSRMTQCVPDDPPFPPAASW